MSRFVTNWTGKTLIIPKVWVLAKLDLNKSNVRSNLGHSGLIYVQSVMPVYRDGRFGSKVGQIGT